MIFKSSKYADFQKRQAGNNIFHGYMIFNMNNAENQIRFHKHITDRRSRNDCILQNTEY